MTNQSRTSDEEADILAAELALGTLDAAEIRAAERRMLRDPAFAASVEAWRERLAPLGDAVTPAQPPADTWAAIERDLARMTRRPRSGTAGDVAIAQRRAERRDDRVASLWRWLGLGGTGLAAASLAALALIAAGIWTPGPSERDTLTATLESEAGVPLLTVVLDRASGTATLVPIDMPGSDGRVPELWLLPETDGGAPRSLGLLDAQQPLRLVLPQEASQRAGAALAVSMEPEGGSPTGLPTGPVVASGHLASI
ncbi:anti-sigma factor [Mangrovicella endophytica]|uniref:anti-sigma factor n=1 Tax=Mangrovicella endophytica TaxID=2066697 RepID=UPI0012FFD775|nr:anti-sigma factor [Mangrovicella endophytica]